MPITENLRKIVHLKRWEFVGVMPFTHAAGVCIASSRHHRQLQLIITSATSAYLYDPAEEGCVAIASPALAGAFGAGTCAVATAVGPSGTVGSTGTTSTINTGFNIKRDLRGYHIHITGGPNAGLTLPILKNEIGANAVITVATQAAAFDNTTTYRLLTPRWYVLNATASNGTTTANLFKYYDYALDVWASPEMGATDGVGPAAVIGTDFRLISTPSFIGNDYHSFANFTATSATNATNATITCTGKTWTNGQWVNFQVRVVSGTGAGQIKTITGSTADTLTLAGVFAIALDNTSVISIEGNDDFIYCTGGNSTNCYKFTIAPTCTWTSIASRGGNGGSGLSGHWVYGVTDPAWNDESAIINGRRIYSFRGGNTPSSLDYYDIPANAWYNVAHASNVETLTTGTKWAYHDDYLYFVKDATTRWFRFDIARQDTTGWGTMLYPQSTAAVGDTAFDITVADGGSEVVWIYVMPNSTNVLLRQMVI